MPPTKIRLLSGNDIRLCLTMQEAIEAVRGAFIQLSQGQADVPPRVHLDIPEQNGVELFMPAYLAATGQVGLKIVSIFNGNAEMGLPTIHALVTVFDAATGRPLAIMDGEYLSALRTGAASGLATSLLARPDARIAAIFGAGRQGRAQLEAMAAVRDLELVYVFDLNPDKAHEFAIEMSQKLSFGVHVARSSHDLQESDIICTATTSRHPVFNDSNIKSGVHINGIGSYKPFMQEIPAETVLRSRVVVDQREGSLAEAGDLIIPLKNKLITEEHIYAEIGEIAAGIKQGRQAFDEITLFKSVGNAVQDLAVANLVLAAAREKKLGYEFEL